MSLQVSDAEYRVLRTIRDVSTDLRVCSKSEHDPAIPELRERLKTACVQWLEMIDSNDAGHRSLYSGETDAIKADDATLTVYNPVMIGDPAPGVVERRGSSLEVLAPPCRTARELGIIDGQTYSSKDKICSDHVWVRVVAGDGDFDGEPGGDVEPIHCRHCGITMAKAIEANKIDANMSRHPEDE